jgi:hypothetical protein
MTDFTTLSDAPLRFGEGCPVYRHNACDEVGKHDKESYHTDLKSLSEPERDLG